MSLLTVRNLNLSIGYSHILRDVGLEVSSGEIVSVTGESGSGKSMTALAIMGLAPESAKIAGEINLEGRNLLEADEAEMCAVRGGLIGMVFQEPMTALNPLMTIGDQVAETVLAHEDVTRAEARERAARMLERVGLPQKDFPLSRYPHELSGGQRQRVVIALAIVQHPKLLIADEPTTALDVTTQAKILVLLRELVAEFDMGMILITHDLAVVSDIADRIVVMKNGEVVEQGETRSLFENMQHPYTRTLFEASGHKVQLPEQDQTGVPVLQVNAAVRKYPLPRYGLFRPREYSEAVRGVSFTISEGERVGLVGESGCGKSTLTRAILGLDPLQGGEIRAFGNMVGPDMNPDQRAKLQVVFQDPYGSFNPRHRVSRIVTEPFHLLPDPPRGSDRTGAVAEALKAVGLQPEDADKFIHEFSGGQRQRIAIARALIIRPKLIVFDEAVSALDVSVRAKILDLIAELSRNRDLAHLFISHDLSVVRTVTDRVMVMQAGQIVEQGETEAVFTNPQHPYTKSLIDAAPVLPDISHLKEALNAPA